MTIRGAAHWAAMPVLAVLAMLLGVSAARSTDDSILKKGGGWYKVGAPYQINGQLHVPAEMPDYRAEGIASWYGGDFHGRRTANGEIYDMNALTAAHKTLPLPSYVRVTNTVNNRTLLVRVNDRGPFVDGRIIDLSRAAARLLDVEQQGHAQVTVVYAGPAPIDGKDDQEWRFLASQTWHDAQASDAAKKSLAAVEPLRTPPQAAMVTGSLPLPRGVAPAAPPKAKAASSVERPEDADAEDAAPARTRNKASVHQSKPSASDDDHRSDWRCAAFGTCASGY